MAMFTETSSIKEAVSLINRISSSKLPLLLSRLIDKLHVPEEAVFTETEITKLSSSFKISKDEIDLVLTTCKFFLSQAAYHNSKPAAFAKQLAGIGVEEEKCNIFQEVWAEGAKSVISMLRQKSVASHQLETINWELSLQIAQKSKTKQKTPCAVFEFGIKDTNTQTTDRTQIEFDHKELYQFFNQLDTIQSQLDGLT